MISRDDIRAAHVRVAPHIRATPVVQIEAGGMGVEFPVWLKLEQVQVTGSFKVRGAFNAMVSQDIPGAGVVAASGGNHGAAVAYAATKLGIKSTIFVPKLLANEVKLARMRGFGGDVVLTDGSVGDVMRIYGEHATRTGALAVHPYDTAPTLTGQGTLGLEIERQIEGIDTVLIAVGGGGLIGGVAAWFDGRVNVVAVESDGTATLNRALRDGLGGDLQVSGVASSSLGAPDIGVMPFEIAKRVIKTNIMVSDDDIYAAQNALWQGARIIGEPGAATALAALTSGAYVPEKGEKICVVVCGGNAEPGWFLKQD
jgi:threonine dehydratase